MLDHNIVTGLYWFQGSPALYAFFEAEEKAVALKQGAKISLRAGKDRYCIGRYDTSSNLRTTCEQNSKIPLVGPSQCAVCRLKDQSFTAKTGIASNKADEQLLDTTHVTYLALFGDSSTPKVGVARLERFSERLHEQGAWAGLALVTTDGSSARHLEQSIHNSLHLPLSVRMDKKLSNICNEMNKGVAKSQLEQVAKTIDFSGVTKRDTPPEFASFIYPYPDFQVQTEQIGSTMQLITSLEADFEIGGTILGIYGKEILLHVHDMVYALDSRLLEGRLVTLHNQPTDTSEKPLGIVSKRILVNKQGRLL